MEGIDKYEHLKSREARNQWIRDMLYQILIDWEKVTDKDSMWFRERRINEPNWIFQLEFGTVTDDTVSLYHIISNKLQHIEPWDTIVRVHVRPKTEFTNPNHKSSKELMIDGMKRVRDEILKLPAKKRPQYFMSYSHITSKFAGKYWFQVYNVPENIKSWNWSMWFFDPKVQESRRQAIQYDEEQLKNETDTDKIKELQYRIKNDKSYLSIPQKYSPDDIKLIIEPIDHLLNITNDYFEQLKKPSS